jgi:hypothetical protein
MSKDDDVDDWEDLLDDDDIQIKTSTKTLTILPKEFLLCSEHTRNNILELENESDDEKQLFFQSLISIIPEYMFNSSACEMLYECMKLIPSNFHLELLKVLGKFDNFIILDSFYKKY